MKQKAALLMGATGLVGCECLKLLTDDAHYHRIVVPTRTPPAERVGSRKVPWTLSESAITGIF
jgi:uncharacterized protein YbjT (DUF2867 family)